MSQPENIGSFFEESKPLIKEYVETRLELFRLYAIRLISHAAGYLVWILISLFFVLLLMIFSGIVLGVWFSQLFHSEVLGFGLTTLLILAVFIVLAAFRRTLFVNPVINAIIRRTNDELGPDSDDL